MKEIILHFGSPKTATTSIQHFLARNRVNLLNQNILYPDSGCPCGDIHHALILDLLDEYTDYKTEDWQYGIAQKGNNWEKLINEINSSSAEKVIISSEMIFGFFLKNKDTLKAFNYIKDTLKDYKVKVVVYLRPQDQYQQSIYNQQIKSGQASDSINEFIKRIPGTKCNYLKVLLAWADVFGKENIVIKSFNKPQLLNNDIIQDFCSTVGISYNDCEEFKVQHNPALPDGLIGIKRKINESEYDLPLYREKINELLLDLDYPTFNKKLTYFSSKNYLNNVENYKIENEKISKYFLNGETLFIYDYTKNNELAYYDDVYIDYEKMYISFKKITAKKIFKKRKYDSTTIELVQKGFDKILNL